ncbi:MULTISPECIES: hypothetical protein [unclassified Paraburkholderia]|uniref:hypothetical protein n=1 Tax=unclassified Paraburkholderia TaxID=2615204 RepID=UPI00161B3CB3|nr:MULTISPECIES: hypothetical protein [unclassified Paraburkholderia]MBB5443944.1 hypothetical protein [Paraburkholderia sp. WSM4177]MBB5484930.1 hypothetical protein [Paraburkholderia sp. WSM4180]
MTCQNERIVGALLVLMSGYAFAGGPFGDVPQAMMVANIVASPVEVVPPIPEPRRYFEQQRYAMEYRGDQGKPFFAQMENYYSVDVTRDAQLGTAKALMSSGPEFAPVSEPGAKAVAQNASNPLHLGPSTAPQLSIVQMNSSVLSIGASPQRRLSLTIDNWVFSGTARVAILHSHDTGATLIVKRRY